MKTVPCGDVDFGRHLLFEKLFDDDEVDQGKAPRRIIVYEEIEIAVRRASPRAADPNR
jgi:hypothetical protein